jgi:hypothetical protein
VGGNGIEAGGVVFDEVVVEPVVLDHQVEDAVEQRDVTPRLDGQKNVGRPGDRRDPRILNDDLAAGLARLPDVIRRDRRALGRVRPGDPDGFGAEDVVPRVGAAVDPESLLVRCSCGNVMAAARTQPHMISQWASQRKPPR